MRFAFMEDHWGAYPVSTMCRLMEVSRGGFYSWRRRPVSAREQENRRLIVEIRAIHASRRRVYGSPRMHAELIARGWRCGKNRVARLMRLHGIRARVRRQFRVTTKSDHQRPIAPNLVQRQF
jgi:putative transposase